MIKIQFSSTTFEEFEKEKLSYRLFSFRRSITRNSRFVIELTQFIFDFARSDLPFKYISNVTK